ncbi:MAG TPA: glycoside hydrolase family 88 protein [Cellulomonas sp.]
MTDTDAGATGDFAPDAALHRAFEVIDANIETFGTRYPADTTTGSVYPLRPATADLPAGSNYGWTTSFWTGQLWLAYQLTGAERYRAAGVAQIDSFAHRVEAEIDLHTHDLGFLYTLGGVAPWLLTQDERARDGALAAADHLMTRVMQPAGIVQAWGDPAGDPAERGRTIIDSLMNMPLLHWAGAQRDDPRYARAAVAHVSQLRDHILRPDDTTFHTFYWDPVTGEPLRGTTQQGYADDSCWARGQAWGVYGFALSYCHTRDESFLVAARRCARYYLDHLPADQVAYWDLVFTDGSGQPRDTSAASVAACGLLELAAWEQDPAEQQRLRAAATRMVASLAEHYTGAAVPGSNALLLHGVYDWPSGVGVDEGNLWGDYYYLEALTRIVRPDWAPYWRAA